MIQGRRKQKWNGQADTEASKEVRGHALPGKILKIMLVRSESGCNFRPITASFFTHSFHAKFVVYTNN